MFMKKSKFWESLKSFGHHAFYRILLAIRTPVRIICKVCYGISLMMIVAYFISKSSGEAFLKWYEILLFECAFALIPFLISVSYDKLLFNLKPDDIDIILPL